MREAAALGALDSFITCCPKDLTMFEDARKTSGHEKDFVVEDLAELVAEAIELKSLTLKDIPPLTERITDAVAHRIADVVAARLDQILATRLPGRSLAPPHAEPVIEAAPPPEIPAEVPEAPACATAGAG